MNALFDAAGLTVFERGWLSSNNVLFDGGDSAESVLVDTGYCTHAEQTVALVRRALGTRPLQRVVNTHLHSDHCGGNRRLQDMFGCAVSVPAGEAAKVDAWDEAALTYRATGQRCPRFRRTDSIAAGDHIRCGPRKWLAIAAPGHDPESIVLYEPELELLISADALWETGFGVVFPELEGESAFGDVRATLEMLEKLPVQWVIPGHGKPFRGIHESLARAHARLDGFIADPARHARHAARVLIKFHLLEVQSTPLSQLLDWMQSTPYLRIIHELHTPSTDYSHWCVTLVSDLVGSGALSSHDGVVRNI